MMHSDIASALQSACWQRANANLNTAHFISRWPRRGFRSPVRTKSWMKCSRVATRRERLGSALERDDFSSSRHPALAFWWSMIFSENRYPLFGIML
jgi:hypothetical protein